MFGFRGKDQVRMKHEVRWQVGNHAQRVCDESKGGKTQIFVWSPYVLESPGRGGSVEVV